MNKTETLAYNWLLDNGYSSDDITFQSNKSPDFICKDKKRFEVKKLNSNTLIFTKNQIEKFKASDTILVFDKGKFVSQFSWDKRDTSHFNFCMHINKGKVISVSDELHDFLKKKTINKETYDATIKRLLKFGGN